MKKFDNYETLKAETSETANSILAAGPYIVQIVSVQNDTEKEYLKITFDIVDGPNAKRFQEAFTKFGTWPGAGITYRSYKQTAQSYFTAFIIALEKSNPGFVWNWEETQLVGKKMVVNYREEEAMINGEMKTVLRVAEVRSIQSLKEGKIKLLSKKTLDQSRNLKSIEIDDKDLPF